MEYTSFVFDVVIGFVCGLLGLLHIFEVKKDFVANTGLIGLICGIIGFVLTFVYVIFNGLVFTSNYSGIGKAEENGVFTEKLSSNGYKCLNYDDSGDVLSLYAKISELNKKQYNYDKDLHKSYQTALYNGCKKPDEFHNCEDNGGVITVAAVYIDGSPKFCPFLYIDEEEGVSNKDMFDRFLTALILSLVVCLANIGLALFGFLLFRTPGDF